METKQGRSFHPSGKDAFAEATAEWDASFQPDVVFLFVSTQQSADAVAAAAKTAFPNAVIVGCTSTGESLGGEHSNGAVAVAAIRTPAIRWASVCVPNLDGLSRESIGDATRTLFESLDVDADNLEPHKLFCVNFIDGLRLKEEEFCAHLTEALDGVAFVGGSAGDDLAFRETRVIFGGESHTNAAVLVMGRAEHESAFEIIKHQHFTRSPKRMVITKCVPAERRVVEIDGYPAAEAYARAIGLHVDSASLKDALAEAAFLQPVMIAVENEIYVRSVQAVDDDGSLRFYCAIEEGMVMEVADHHDMAEHLRRDFAPKHQKKARFMLTCNCILRALEAKAQGLHPTLDAVLQDVSEASIGFDTYGEQLDGLHMNQTLVALALHE